MKYNGDCPAARQTALGDYASMAFERESKQLIEEGRWGQSVRVCRLDLALDCVFCDVVFRRSSEKITI